MKMSRRLAIVSFATVILLSPTVRAEGEPLSDTQIELIRQNCVTAQSSMQRLEQNEAVARRNRGVGYESMLKLMAALNSRIAINKLNAPELGSITANIEKRRNDFTEAYIAYNNSFKTTMRLANCREQPVTFYDNLTQTRSLRNKLSATIDDIDRLLNDYQTNLTTLKQTVTAPPSDEVAP